MKIMHMADLHLDSKMETHLTREQARERKNELLLTCSRYVDYAKQEGIEVVLIAGDVFDTKEPTKKSVNGFREYLSRYPEIQYYILKGNHDSGDILVNLSSLPNVHLFDNSWTKYSLDSEEKVILTGAEFSDKNENIFAGLLLDKDKFNILMLHGQDVAGKSEKNVGIIPIKALEYHNIDYLALGHIHKHREGRIDNRGIYVYPGCMENRGFDEAEEHGVIILDIDTATGSFTKEFINLESRRCIVQELDITDCSSAQEVETIARPVLSSLDTRALVEVVLTGELSLDADIDTTYLEQVFGGDFYFLKWKKQTRLKIDMEQYEKEISLKGEFIRLVQADTELTDEMKAEIIRMGIKALRQEDVSYDNYLH